MAPEGTLRVLVIGVGNPYRGDDGVGLWAAQQARSRLKSNVPVMEFAGDLTPMLDRFRDADAVILMDAARSGAPPGAVSRFDARAGPLPSYNNTNSTHGIGLAQVIELARTLECLPQSVLVYAIEGGCFEVGANLTPEVEKAALSVVDEVVSEVARWEEVPTAEVRNA